MQLFSNDFRASWRDCGNPAALFMQFWLEASSWSPADRSALPGVEIDTRKRFAGALELSDGRGALDQLCELIEERWPRSSTSHSDFNVAGSLILAAMRAIDSIFALTHPRTRAVSPSLGSTGRLPHWVDALNQHRLRTGSFTEGSSHRVVPHGPFARHARGRDAESGDSLRNGFAYLTVAPRSSLHDGRSVAISMKVVGTDIARGVPASATIGRESIQFIPLAEEASDLSFASGIRNGHPVLDVQPAVSTSDRLLAALSGHGNVDIAFAPELTLAGSDEDKLHEGIKALKDNAPRIIMAGSGLSVGKGPCGRAWNEARIYARGGKMLWKHRKVWPFGMQRDAALSYGFADPGTGNMLMEDIASSAEITVVDLDGFGRCIVLICQDFQCRPLVDDVIRDYQPDWVFTPILDPGIKIPGWAHQRAQDLSKLSQARLLVGSSLSMTRLGHHASLAEPAVGLAVGPYNPHPADAAVSRAVALVEAVAGPTPRSGVLVWDERSAPWKRTSVGAV